jgi:hypothetical protein
MGMTRAQFLTNLDDSLTWLGTPAASTYASVLPSWMQSGPWGWPMPFMNEMLFGCGQLGIQTIITPLVTPVEGAIEQIGTWITGLNNWLHSRTDNCESSEDFADAVEEYASANSLGDVWTA